jgi:hypothetical protein
MARECLSPLAPNSDRMKFKRRWVWVVWARYTVRSTHASTAIVLRVP